MDKLPMCRICLAENVHMYVVVNKTLHDLYEKLTDNPFVTEDSRPILACFICCAQLKKCYRFQKKCLEAEEQFAKMMNEEYERKPLINQDHVELFHGFIRTPTSIVDVDQTEGIVVKEESPGVSESDSEDDVPLIEMKTEVDEQESSKRKRKSKKTYNREPSPISMQSNEELTQCLQNMMDDTVFSDRNDPLSTFIPGVVPERRLSEETVVSVTKKTETISEEELSCNENSSLVPTHEDQYGNEFCESLEAYPIRTNNVRNLPTNVSSKDSIKKTDMRKKRLIHKQRWIDVRRKKLKNEGKSFTNKRGKIIPEKVIGQPCRKTCRYKCTENYDLKQRESIFSNFWGLGDRHKHWEFVIKYTKKNNKMRRTTEITKHNREFTFIYYLPSAEVESKRVCKQMFLNTISCSDRIIKTAWKKFDGLASVERDYRGKYERSPRVKPYRESSPIQVHFNEELTQCLQDMMDDTVFSDRNDPLSTFIPGVLPERRLSEETVVSVTKGTETISEDELTCIENLSLVPTHEDQYGNEFCESLEAYPIRTNNVRNLPTNVSSKDSIKKTDMRKKRLIHKQHWIDVQRKKLKNEGKSFTNKRGKIIPEKVLGQPCGKTCRYKCTENYDLKQRESIFTNFWGLGDRHKHWEFVIKYTKKINKMRRTTEITKHNREFTFIYYLPSAEVESKRVCKQMFLNTISCSDRIIKTAWKKFDGLTSVEKDNRGKYERSPRVKQYRESSPIQVHSNEELTQCLQDMMDDTVFSGRNDPLSTFIPGVLPERRLSEETLVSVTKGTETISEDELTCIENSSLVPTHEDQYGNEFCESLEAYPRADDVRNLPTNVSSKDFIKKTNMRKKKLIHKQHWIDVRRKKLKNEGKSFTNKRGKIIPEKVLGQPCRKTCRYKCTENYDLKQRESIFSNFWGLGDRHKHWEFVIKYTKKINKMRRTTEITKHNREFTFIYYLPSKEMERKRVCKQMFLNTISCSDRIIKTAWKKFDGLTSVEKDNRGKYERSPRVKPCRESSPIQVHSNEELTQSLQDMMDDTVFSGRNDPLSTFIPGVLPERRLSEQTVVSVTKGTKTISEDELTCNENSSLVPTHEDQYSNEFCESLEAYPRADDVRNLPIDVSSKDFIKKTNMRKTRLIHKQHWIDVQRKKLKNEGKCFTNKRGKIIPEKVIGQPCRKTCRYKCTENYDLKQRESIFSNFWGLGDRHKHWEFVIKYTKKINKMRRTTEITKHNREFTFIYYLPNEEMERKRVCKQMFLNTISCSDRIIKTAWKKFDGLTSVEKDNRGKYERSPRVKPYRESSPIQVHSNEELTQSLQDMMDDTVFSDRNDPLSTFMPGVLPERRLSEETVVSIKKETETISEDELTCIENLSLLPTHEDQCCNEFCKGLEAYSIRTSNVRNLPTNVSSKDSIKKTDMRKKRLLHKQHWIDVRRKKLKNEGKSFTNKRGKIIPEKVLGQPCEKKCRYKCTENYDLKQRERIFSNFWGLGDRHKHWKFVIKYTKKINKMRRTTEITKHNREFTFIYYLPSEEMESKRVCKQMFLNTISCSDRIIKTAWKKFDGLESVERDYRGKYEHKPRKKQCEFFT